MYFHRIIILFLFIIHLISIYSYSFDSTIDNLLYVRNTSTLYAISSSHLHQLHWSSSNQTLLLLHRRIRLHSSLDNSDYGVSVFLYHSSEHLIIICARSITGRCIFYDSNDISRMFIPDSTLETNNLGCLEGCYTFISSTNIIHSALIGNRHDRNGNIINSQVEFQNDMFRYNIKYNLQSNEHGLITSIRFLSDRIHNIEYIYGFNYQQYTYYILKTSRLARLCQASVSMSMTYEEIPIRNCRTNSSIITGAYHSFDIFDYLYIIYDNIICVYTMENIIDAFFQSKYKCQSGIGYRLGYIINTNQLRPTCEKVVERSLMPVDECAWQPYRTNTFMDGTVAATGEMLYEIIENNIRILFIFAKDDIIVIGTNERHVLKFIRTNPRTIHLLYAVLYQNEPFNPQYIIDEEHEILVFAVGSELHRYAYNSCSLYDTCQTCIGSRRYDSKPCIWSNGRCILSMNPLANDRGCPPSIHYINPMNASVNAERITLTISGSFEGVLSQFVQVFLVFPLANQKEYFCSIQTIQTDSLTCNLMVPKQALNGLISIDIKPQRLLTVGDTDISGLIEYPQMFHVYIPKPILEPNYGPAAGGTKVQIRNLVINFPSLVKIYFGKNECQIIRYDSSEDKIECINQACSNNNEILELSIEVNNYPWQIEKTYFQCRANPIIFDWYPKRAFQNGAIKLLIIGQNLNVVQNPLMKFTNHTLGIEYVSSCEIFSTSQIICLSPNIHKELDLILPIDLEVSFILDNVQIIPNDFILTIVNEPFYQPFKDSIQYIDSKNIIEFQGTNLATTHSIDQINVQIESINNACVPFNFTETQLLCSLSKEIIDSFQNSEPHVEIHIGDNLTFSIGRILFSAPSQPSSLLIPYLSRQFGSWGTFIFIVMCSITILTFLFTLVIVARRRLYRASKSFHKETKPPQYYQSVWNEIGKSKHLHRKHLTIYEKVGQGCFGDVYRGLLKQNGNKSIEVAIKVLRDQSISSIKDFLCEANRMKDFSHPNILSLIGVTWDPSKKAMVVLPYMKNGDLRSYIINENNRPTIRQLITWGIQVADGMEYLASLKFVHRDLATRNCMLDQDLICRISDFGLSRDVFDRDYYTLPAKSVIDQCGKSNQLVQKRLPVRWLSPESIETSIFTTQSDVWSFGVLLWELMSRGRTPYGGVNNADVYQYIKQGYRLQQPSYCPLLLYKSVMILCWNADPSQRPTFTQIAHDIRHILHQLELRQQRKQSSSADEDDTTIIQRFPIDRSMKNSLRPPSILSNSMGDEQHVTTSNHETKCAEIVIENKNDDDDAYIVGNNANSEMFSTTRLLPEYTETSIMNDA